MNLTTGGLFGYCSLNDIDRLKVPSSNGVSLGLERAISITRQIEYKLETYPKMIAFQFMISLSLGAALMPGGASVWILGLRFGETKQLTFCFYK